MFSGLNDMKLHRLSLSPTIFFVCIRMHVFVYVYAIYMYMFVCVCVSCYFLLLLVQLCMHIQHH